MKTFFRDFSVFVCRSLKVCFSVRTFRNSSLKSVKLLHKLKALRVPHILDFRKLNSVVFVALLPQNLSVLQSSSNFCRNPEKRFVQKLQKLFENLLTLQWFVNVLLLLWKCGDCSGIQRLI